MRILPCAADFECYVNGELLPWNDPFGLSARWRVADLMKSNLMSRENACRMVTMSVQKELRNTTSSSLFVVLPKKETE